MTAPAIDTPPPPTTPKTPVNWLPTADLVLTVLVVLLAALAATFVSRNSDQWIHFAAGRDLASGKYHLGSDPYSYLHTTWVNANWLYDAVIYQIYAVSPEAVTVVKSVIFALAVLVALRVRKADEPAWPWWLVAGLAIVAAAQHTPLRPAVVSALFVSVLLYVLFKCEWTPGSWRNPVRLALLTALWANVDQWFFLAPLTVILVAVAELLQGKTAKDYAKTFLLCFAASLLNPHLFGVWQVPFEFGLSMTESLKQDPYLATAAIPTYRSDYFDNASLGKNTNGAAYLVLLLLGGGLLAFGSRKVRLACVFVWLLYAAIALLTYRGILFFAIAAIPLTAIPLSALATATANDPRTKVPSSLVRVFGLIAVVTLIVCAIPGWLHPKASQPWLARRVALGVEPEPGLERTAKMLNDLRATGKLDGLNGTPLAVDLADHVAFFAPNEKVAVNSRLRHHAADLEAFTAPNAALRNESLAAYTKALKELGSHYITITGSNAARHIDGSILNLARPDTGLSLWHIDGRAAVFGPPGKGVMFNPVPLAFAAKQEKLPDPLVIPPTPKSTDPLDVFFLNPKPVPPEALDAALLQSQALMLWLGAVRAHEEALLGFAGPIVLFGPRSEPEVPDGAIAVKLLAMRRARQAAAANPDHPLAYGALALASMENGVPLPGVNSEETAMVFAAAARRYLDRMPPIDTLSDNDAGLVRVMAENLAKYYGDRQMMDLRRDMQKLALLAYRRQLAFTPADKTTPEKLKAQIEGVDKAIGNLDKQGEAIRDKLAESDKLPDRERVRAAMQNGLIGEMITRLKAVKEPDLRRELEIIQWELRTGMLEAAYEDMATLTQKLKKNPPDTETPQVQAALAGIYAQAARLAGDYDHFSKFLDKSKPAPRSAALRQEIRHVTSSSESLEARYNGLGHFALGGLLGRDTGMAAERPIIDQWLRDADYLMQRGINALFAGDMADARNWFEQALAPDGIPLPPFLPQRAIAERYLKLLNAGK